MSAGCEACGTVLGLTSRGKLRKDKRFCSVECQQGAILKARRYAREVLPHVLATIQMEPRTREAAIRLRKALRTLGLIPRDP